MEDSKFLRLFLIVLMMVTVVVVWWKVANYLGSMAVSTLSRVVVSKTSSTDVRAVQLLRDFLRDKENMDIMMVLDKFAREGRDPFSPPIVESNSKKAVSVEKPVMPTIVLRGIVASGNVKIAVLDIGDKKGVIAKEGEKVGEVRVISISDGKVMVKWRSEKVVLNLK